jgi:hypothetical protein
MQKKKILKLANHPLHMMKKESTTVEEVVVSGSSQKRAQKRLAIRFTCICNEEDIFYRQVDHPDMVMSEYTKPAKK